MIISIPLERILSNPWQTRHAIDEEYIGELAADISANGLLQRPLARLIGKDGKPLHDMTFDLLSMENATGEACAQLAFGHNRLAAFRKLFEAGDQYFGKLPMELRELVDIEMADMAWSENEKRREHSPIDRAFAIHQRIQDFGWTHDQAAEHLRISRPAISNALRLLKLPRELQDAAHKGEISERQALVLVSLFDLPEPLRERAEKGESEELRPSAIAEAARAGLPSDDLRARMNNLVGVYAIPLKLAIWPLEVAFFDMSEQVRSLRCEGCELIVQRDGQEMCGAADCFQVKTLGWKKRNQPAEPLPAEPEEPGEVFEAETVTEEEAVVAVMEAAPAVQSAAPTPSKPKAPPAPAPAPRPAAPEPVKNVMADDPHEYEKAQITATITWWPADGDPRGRMVVIGVRSHQDSPIMRTYRQEGLQIQGELDSLLEELKSRLEKNGGAA